MKKFLTTKDVADMLQVQDRRTVAAFLAGKGVLPIRVGRLLRWDSEQVMLALASMHHVNERSTRRQGKRAKKTPPLLTMSAAEIFRTVCGASAPLQ